MGNTITSTLVAVNNNNACAENRPSFARMSRGSKGLSDEKRKNVQRALQRIKDEGRLTQQEIARRIGVTQQAVSDALNGEAGVHFAAKMADTMAIPYEELVGGDAKQFKLEPHLFAIQGWDLLEKEARGLSPWVPEAAWEAVRNLRTAMPPRVITSHWISSMAAAWAPSLGGQGDQTERVRLEMEEADRKSSKPPNKPTK